MSEPIAGTYEGFRLFQVDGHRLESIAQRFTYEPGLNRAMCLAGEKHDPRQRGATAASGSTTTSTALVTSSRPSWSRPGRPTATATSGTMTRFPTWYSAR